jgi:tetratricopeptide (TPR) repeat protein
MAKAVDNSHILVGLLVLVSLLGSIALVPKGEELALIYLRARDYVQAERIYAAEVEKGNLSPTAIEPLSRLYVQQGRISAAIEVLERFAERHPASVVARQLLGTYYQWAQRPRDFRDNLVALAALAPTEATLRQLAAFDSFTGDVEGEIAALQRLLALYPGMPDDYVDLANLLASRGHLLDAARQLQTLQKRQPEAISDNIVDLWVNLLVEAKQPEAALAVARTYLAQHPAGTSLRHIAEIFAARALPEQGLALLEGFSDLVAADPQLTLAKYRFAVDSGRTKDVARELATLWSSQGIPAKFYGQYVLVASAAGDRDLALAIAARMNLSSEPAEVVANVIDAAIEAGKPALLEKFRAEAGSAFLAIRPVLAARLALALGSREEAKQWADRAFEHGKLAPQQRLELAEVYSKLGRADRAVTLMAALATGNALPDADYPQLAALYIALKRAVEGAALFDRLLVAERHRPGVFEGWALTSAAAGRADAVANALTPDKARSLGDRSLLDLYYEAADLKAAGLALLTARLLVDRHDDPDDRLRLANALLMDGKLGEALPLLRALRDTGLPDARSLYVDALTQAAKHDEAARHELEAYWVAELDDPSHSETSRTDAVYALIDLEAWEQVLPALEERARRDPARWLDAYVSAAFSAGKQDEAFAGLSRIVEDDGLPRKQREDALYLLLDKGGPAAAVTSLRHAAEQFGGDWIDTYGAVLRRLGRPAEFVGFLRDRAKAPGTPPKERRAIASMLLSAGDKRDAETIYRALAAEEPPSSDDLVQLLFLWGPRPTAAQLDWLEARARGSSGATKAAWLRRLLLVGAADRVVAVAGADNAVATNRDVAAVQIEALAALHRGDELDRAIATQLDRETDPARLAAYGREALDAGRRATARQAFQKLLAVAPNDRRALRQAGLFAFVDQDYRRCRELLGRYLAGGSGDWEVHYYYGESLLRDDRKDTARQQLQLALAEIDRAAAPTFDMRQARAALLYRLGRTQEALDLYDALLREQPRNKDLRADFAAVLIQLGRLDRASRVLSPTGAAAGP